MMGNKGQLIAAGVIIFMFFLAVPIMLFTNLGGTFEQQRNIDNTLYSRAIDRVHFDEDMFIPNALDYMGYQAPSTVGEFSGYLPGDIHSHTDDDGNEFTEIKSGTKGAYYYYYDKNDGSNPTDFQKFPPEIDVSLRLEEEFEDKFENEYMNDLRNKDIDDMEYLSKVGTNLTFDIENDGYNVKYEAKGTEPFVKWRGDDFTVYGEKYGYDRDYNIRLLEMRDEMQSFIENDVDKDSNGLHDGIRHCINQWNNEYTGRFTYCEDNENFCNSHITAPQVLCKGRGDSQGTCENVNGYDRFEDELRNCIENEISHHTPGISTHYVWDSDYEGDDGTSGDYLKVHVDQKPGTECEYHYPDGTSYEDDSYGPDQCGWVNKDDENGLCESSCDGGGNRNCVENNCEDPDSVGCTRYEHTGTGEQCDPNNFCEDDTDCSPGQVCCGNSCKEPEQQQQTCEDGLVWNECTGQCVEPPEDHDNTPGQCECSNWQCFNDYDKWETMATCEYEYEVELEMTEWLRQKTAGGADGYPTFTYTGYIDQVRAEDANTYFRNPVFRSFVFIREWKNMANP